jgi:hypothetical protein
LPRHPGFGGYRSEQPLQTQPVALHAGSPKLFPIAYLVVQEAESTIPKHFHRVDQFQVFAGGSGNLNRLNIRPFTAQYANGYSPYGPIRAGSNGIDYYVLRLGWDVGAQWMPESEEALYARKDRKPRNVVYDALTPMAQEAAAQIMTSTSTALEEPSPDGLAAWRLRIAPNGDLQAADPATGGGQFFLVIAGGLIQDNTTLPAGSILFASRDEEPMRLRAGTAGTEVLMMQFPLPQGQFQ